MYSCAKSLVLPVFLLALLSSCSASLLPYGRSDQETKQFYQKYEKVQLGMTRDKVREILGKPDMSKAGISIAEAEKLEKSEKSKGIKIFGLTVGGEDITPTAGTWIYLYPSKETVYANPAVSFDLRTNIVNKIHSIDEQYAHIGKNMGWEHLAEEGKLGHQEAKQVEKHLKLVITPEKFW